MSIEIANAATENIVFITLFLVLLLFTCRKFNNNHAFNTSLTEELKGFAILAVIFSHIGYFLVTDNRFLFPLSTIAGVGVNLFLFLSGMGLTFSSLKQNASIISFYLKRLPKLFIPMWIVLTLFIVTDYFWLGTSYPIKTIIQSYLGFFPAADLFQSINSPLWYFTLILFYYLIFPLVFYRKLAYLAPVVLLLLPYWLLKRTYVIEHLDINVINLYSIHFVSFPLGVFFALLIQDKKLGALRFHFKNIFLRSNLVLLLVPLFLAVFAYTSINSGVGLEKDIEQTTSLITMFSIIFVFIAKNIRFRIFDLFGKYSYEIYLLHWPLLARYDYLYKTLPASLATILFLGEFLLLALVLQRVSGFLQKK